MKILAVLENDLYIRNFIISGAFDDLLKNKNFKICTSDLVTELKKDIPKGKHIGNYKRHEKNLGRVRVFLQISMKALSSKSSTFKIKSDAYIKNIKEKIINRIFSTPFTYPLAKNYFSENLEINRSLEKIIKKFKPDIVIFPFTGNESTGPELVILSKKYNFMTLFLVNGWDNLSSKGVFLFKPDYLGVWGQQQLVDAYDIQGIPPERCFLLGCARFEDYFKNLNPKSIFKFKYILFAGAATANDELTPLNLLEKIMDQLRIADIKIMYRPHPWRHQRKSLDFFDPEKYKHIILDPQVADNYIKINKSGVIGDANAFYPELDYYPKLLANALFIISPLSSILIEGAIYDVPSLVLAHPDPFNLIPASEQAKWHHFRGAREIYGWYFADSLKEIEEKFKKMLRIYKNDDLNKRLLRTILSNQIKKYIFFDNQSYSQRLKTVVDIINSSQ